MEPEGMWRHVILALTLANHRLVKSLVTASTVSVKTRQEDQSHRFPFFY